MLGERVVVIGAGIGGLSAAALLAARGMDVTVWEAAATPGGKVRRLAGVDAGPTVFTLRDVFDELFDQCGASLDAEVAMRPAATLARHAWGEDRLDLHADPRATEAAIGDFAGAAEARGYAEFRAEARRLFEALERPFLCAGKADPLTLGWRMGAAGFRDYLTLHPYTSMWRALGGYFRDWRLRQLFARYATYCGSSPFRAPATMLLIAHVEARGVWLVDGGLSALAEALERVAQRRGAVFRYETPVAEVLIERGRAAGVVLASGERIAADAVVVNADPAALAAGRFGMAARHAIRSMSPRRRSLSAMVWTALARPSGFPLIRHNVFFSPDYPAEFTALGEGRLADDPSVYVCAQDRGDSGTGGPGPERVQIIVNAPATGDAHPPTPMEIDRCTRAMQATLSRAGLSLELTPEHTRLTTPADFERLFPSTGGALYGPASHGWAASFRRPGARTRIPGLYLAGGGTHPGAGVPMAALSANLAVGCLLKDHASTCRSRPAAMPGGISTRPARTAATG